MLIRQDELIAGKNEAIAMTREEAPNRLKTPHASRRAWDGEQDL